VQDPTVNTQADADSPTLATQLTQQSPFEAEIATLIVSCLHLEIAPGEIDPTAPLFGDGLGLDSIDALELALAISRDYGLELKSDDERNRTIFANLRSLAAHVETHRTK
jgi:acyl carrier protein